MTTYTLTQEQLDGILELMVIRTLEAQAKQTAELEQAAQAVIDRWDTPLWKDVPATAEYINKLREALK